MVSKFDNRVNYKGPFFSHQPYQPKNKKKFINQLSHQSSSELVDLVDGENITQYYITLHITQCYAIFGKLVDMVDLVDQKNGPYVVR